MKKTCEQSVRLQLLKDNALEKEAADRVKEHLRECEPCQDEWDSMNALSRVLSELDDQEVPPDFDRTFWMRVDEYNGKGLFSFFGGRSAGRWRIAFAPLLAAIIMAAGLYVSVQTMGNKVEELSLSDQMDLLDDFDVVNNLDLLEDWVAMNQMKEDS
ncbi:MAG: zf-HC2 domain-containing protein [Proteobacteria bacterium]|nr:zf-HC2 domain-containing protein [Pseudomonadota bacterium]